METAGGQRRLAQLSEWGAPRARTQRGSRSPGSPGVRTARPGRDALRPARPAREPRTSRESGHGPALRHRQSWFQALEEAAPCGTDRRDFRAPGRLCTHLEGTWGGPSSVGVGGGGGLRNWTPRNRGSPGLGSAPRTRARAEWKVEGELIPLSGGGLTRASNPGLRGVRLWPPAVSLPGPPVRVSARVSPLALRVPPRPGRCPGIWVWEPAEWSLGMLRK